MNKTALAGMHGLKKRALRWQDAQVQIGIKSRLTV